MKRIGTGKLREQNDILVYKLLLNNIIVTKRMLADETGLSIVTVGTIINEFENKNIIVENNSIIPPKGRPSKEYRLNKDYFHQLLIYLYVEDNNTYLSFQRLDANDNLLENKEYKYNGSSINALRVLINEQIKKDPFIKYSIIGIPAIISNNLIVDCDIKNLKELNIKQIIENEFNISLLVMNDMNCCSYGYYKNNNTNDDICYVVFPKDTFAGCGTVIDGKLLEGKKSVAGEIAYLPNLNNINYNIDDMADTISILSSIINPNTIVITGSRICEDDLSIIQHKVLKYIPESFIPTIVYKKDINDDYYQGLRYLLNNYICNDI